MLTLPHPVTARFQKTNTEFIRFDGWVHLEKRGKWTRRYLELKFSGLYHYSDTRV